VQGSVPHGTTRLFVRVATNGAVTVRIAGQAFSFDPGTHVASVTLRALTNRIHVTWEGAPGTFEALALATAGPQAM
jgi:hypothetical protein